MPKFTPNNKTGSTGKRVSFDAETAIFDLVRNWWLILIGALIAAMISYVVVTEAYEEKYTSSATFVVTTKGTVSSTVFSNLNTASNLAESFKYILDSDVLMEKVCESLNIDSFSGTVTSTLLPDTNILSLQVTSSSPELTFRVINAIIENHHIVSDTVIASANMDLLQKPTVPRAAAYGMNRNAKIKKYSLLTALGIAVMIVAFSCINDRVKNEQDLTNRIDCDKLAAFEHEKTKRTLRSVVKHGKKNLLVNSPTTSFGYCETFRLFKTKVEYLMKKGNHKVLMVSSVLDDEGKTTVAANLALMLAMSGSKVLLLEGDLLDPCLEKRLGVKIPVEYDFCEYLLEPKPIPTLPKLEGVDNLSLLICRNLNPNSSEAITSLSMQVFMTEAREYFDYIIMDSSPMAYSSDPESLAEYADAAVVVIRQNLASAKMINDAIENLETSGVSVLGGVLNNIERIGLFNTAVGAVGGYGYGYGYGRGYSYGSRKGNYYYGNGGYDYGYEYSRSAESSADKANSHEEVKH